MLYSPRLSVGDTMIVFTARHRSWNHRALFSTENRIVVRVKGVSRKGGFASKGVSAYQDAEHWPPDVLHVQPNLRAAYFRGEPSVDLWAKSVTTRFVRHCALQDVRRVRGQGTMRSASGCERGPPLFFAARQTSWR
eukprot:3565958-Rhodomonas_salina.2